MINFQNLSFWEKESFINHTDYLIVGSGIVGLSTAIYLKQREKGKKVTVLERGFLPTGASTKNAGFSCIGSPSELLDDLSKNSREEVFANVEKRWNGLVNLNNLLGKDNIGYLALGSHELFEVGKEAVYEKCMHNLDDLNLAMSEITGKPRVFNSADHICSRSGYSGFNHAISHAAEGQINTGKMMKALLKKAQSLDVQIFNGIDVTEIGTSEINTNFGKLSFSKLAVCTNGFSKRFFPKIDLEPARAQVLVTSEIRDLKVKGIFHFDEGFYYFRNIGNRILFGGARNIAFEEEKTDIIQNTDKITGHLEGLLRTKIAPEASFTIEHKWAGTMGVGKAKNPIIKEVEPNIYCGIRLGGMGVAIGSLTGKELAELMTERN
jgi:glycine/D-amino acid oxidase-like deaminating enzyme